VSLKITANEQGFVQVGNSLFRLPEPSAEYRIKKLIIYPFADRIPSAGAADESSTNADDYSFSPTCTIRVVRSAFFS